MFIPQSDIQVSLLFYQAVIRKRRRDSPFHARSLGTPQSSVWPALVVWFEYDISLFILYQFLRF